MTEESKKTLIEYYKWVVSLELIIIGSSISLVSLDNMKFSNTLWWGMFLLLISILFNWLLIKRLVISSFIESNKLKTPSANFFRSGNKLLGIYGVAQNVAFLVGLCLIIYSFASGSNEVLFVR